MASNNLGNKKFQNNFEYDGELKYRFIFEKSPIGIFQYNAEAVITECNDSFVEILKSKRELLVGLNMNELKDQSVLPAIHDALKGKNGLYRGPYKATTSDAQLFILLKTTPLTNPTTGKIEGGLGIVEDITELFSTQEELRRKKEHFEILSSLTTDAASILTFNPDGSFNREWLSTNLIDKYGYTPVEIDTFEKWAKIVHPDDVNIYRESIERLKTGQKVSFEVRIIAKNGNTYWINNTVYPEFDSQGKLFRLISAIKDITEKKEREQEIQHQGFLLKSIVDNAPIGIWIVTPDGYYPIINAWFSNNIGYGTSDFSMTEEELEQCRLSDQKAIESDKPIEVTEEVTFTDGLKHILRIHKQKLTSPEGKLIGVLGIATDITERIENEKALVEALEKAEESDRLKSAFLANMSHEIRTPLNGVIGFAKYLRNFPDTPAKDREKFLGIIATSADHLLTLINDIIDVSKIDIGQLTIVPEPFNINTLLNEIYTFFYNANPELAKKGISFTYSTSLPDSEAIINSDRMRVRQILSNFISNAFKFTEKGSVEFGYEVNDDKTEIVFFVKDTGIGIPKDKQEIIFQRFRQAETNTTKLYGGTGLGLSICKSLAELLGGRIWLESEVGSGSRFYFAMPLKHESERTKISKQLINLSQLKNDLKGKTILIAEDEPNSMFFIKTLFKDFDIQILEAHNGLEAVEIFHSQPNIDLILLDIKMPVMNGYDALKKIRSINDSVPIIIQTAHSFSNERALAKAMGCTGFITKPIEADSLYQIISNVLLEE